MLLTQRDYHFHARAVVSFDLPPAKQGQRPESLEKILGANRPQSESLGAKQDPVPMVHPTGERERRVDRWAGCLIPPESARMMIALDTDPPPSFLRKHAEDTGPTMDVHRWANGMPQNSSELFGAIALPPRGLQTCMPEYQTVGGYLILEVSTIWDW